MSALCLCGFFSSLEVGPAGRSAGRGATAEPTDTPSCTSAARTSASPAGLSSRAIMKWRMAECGGRMELSTCLALPGRAASVPPPCRPGPLALCPSWVAPWPPWRTVAQHHAAAFQRREQGL